MNITLRAKHFKNTQFNDHQCGCAIEKAVKELLPSTIRVVESVNGCEIDDTYYPHEYYGAGMFDDDKEKAGYHSFDDTIIREIIFTPQ